MRRILLLLTVALVMAAMVVANAMPAFAKVNCTPDFTRCSGASNSTTDAGAPGGGGANVQRDNLGNVTTSGGGAHQGFGGGGAHCVNLYCNGKLYSGKP